MIDTHAHLTHLDYNESELKNVIKRMDNNIIIASGTNDSDNKEVIDLVNNYENIYGVIGIHPTEIDKISSDSYEFIENNEYFTLRFFSDEYKKDLSILGSKSGKDIDKLSLTGLNAEYNENFVTYKEAVLTIICKKLYSQDLNMDNMSEEIKEKYFLSTCLQ